MSQQNLKDLKEMVKALYPALYIVSYEEKRILNILDNMVKENGMGHKLKIWSADNGLINEKGEKEGGESLSDPIEILRYIKTTDHQAKTMYVLKDFDAYIEEHLTQRSLRSLIEDSISDVTIIILSPILNLPIKLNKSIYTIEWSLPDREERDIIINYDKKAIAISNDEKQKINNAMAGLTELEAVNVIARQAAIDKKKIVSISLLNEEKLNIIRKNPVLEIYQPTEFDTFENIGGWDIAKDYINERKSCLSQDSREFGVDKPKGLLLFGVAGCGKSKFAKCVGKAFDLPVIKLSIPKIMAASGGIVGQAENWISEAFKTIEAVAPVVVFMDEIEKGASGMESSGQSDGGMTSRTITVLLDKLENRNALFYIVATANQVNKLAPEMVRPGRWDKLMFAPLPNKEERKQIIKIHLKQRNFDYKNIDIEQIAVLTDTYTGVEIEQVIIDSVVYAYNNGKVQPTTLMLAKAAKEISPQSKYKAEDIQSLVQWATTVGAKFVSSKESDGNTAQILQLVK
jgi:SpoVK/Ycf46/Vps4 family AAA+-type ATPase